MTAQKAEGAKPQTKSQTKGQAKGQARPPGAKGGSAARRTGNRWVFPAVVAGIVVIGIVVVALTALSGGDDDGGSGGDTVEISAEVAVDGTDLPAFTGRGQDPAVGMDAPTLGSVDFRGRNATAGGATGRPYALVFLAHWCPHCQAEVPRLVSVAEGGQIEGVDVVGVATATTDTQPNYPPSRWLAREDWPFSVLVDDASTSAARAYGLSGYPFMVFVDADGKVAGRISGEISEQDLRRIFSALARGETLPIPGAGASSPAR